MELSQRHIHNLRVVEDRNRLIDLMPRNSIVAEIGVDRGRFARQILLTAVPRRLHLIDIWAPSKTGFPSRYGPEGLDTVLHQFAPQIASGTVVIHQGISYQVLPEFEDEYFDWVYLDTSHKYEDTVAELSGCSAKVKSTGMILGHDYTIGNIDRPVRYGVIEAVNEFCVANDWEVVFLTNESHRCLSYALRRLA